VLGTIHDVKAIADEVHKIPGARLCVDGVALAPHREVDVRALEADFYAFSWYKVSDQDGIPEYGLTGGHAGLRSSHRDPIRLKSGTRGAGQPGPLLPHWHRLEHEAGSCICELRIGSCYTTNSRILRTR